MLKKASILLFLAALIISFGACSNNLDNPDIGGPDSEEPGIEEPDTPIDSLISMKELSSYRLDLSGATALGIMKNDAGFTKGSQTARSLARDYHQEQSYLVMSTTEFSHDATDIPTEDLVAVSFSKVIYEEFETITEGEKTIVASRLTNESEDARISFYSNDGFFYSVYKGDECLIDSIQDNDALDESSLDGVIEIHGLEDGVEYLVKYKGYGTETVITQDEIDGEIDKLYVDKDFTLISFVPKGTSARPNVVKYKENESFDCDAYDLEGYFTDDMRVSFIVVNDTGKIYELPEDKVFAVHNRVIYEDSMGPVAFSVGEDDELIITPLVRNTTIEVIDFFRDTYGKYYVLNDALDGVDPQNENVLFFRWAGKYVPAKNGKVLKFDYSRVVFAEAPDITDVCYVGESFDDEIPIGLDESVDINYLPYDGYGDGYFYTGYAKYICIEDGYLYTLNDGSWYNYGRFDLETKEMLDLSFSTGGSYSGFVGHLDHKTILLGWDQANEEKTFALYCFDVYEKAVGLTDLPHEYIQSKVMLPQINYTNYSDYNDCWHPFDWEFRVDGFDETKYYQVIPDESAESGYSVIETKNYVAPEIYLILQPLT